MQGKRVCLFIFAVSTAVLSTGCRYATNRAADFQDIFILGGGITTENDVTGPWPPSLGVYVQATDFVSLGANHFSGVSAHVDGRGLYAGPESRTRFGLLFWDWNWFWEDPELAAENYYKKPGTLWANRMAELDVWDRAAKEAHQAILPTQDPAIRHYPRGWHYWETISAEFGISEPFITHLGVHFRAGVDPSEVPDFLLGLFMIDPKMDDLQAEELEEARSL